MKSTVLWTVSLILFTFGIGHAGYKLGKMKADKWYHSHSEDCTWRAGEDMVMHAVCSWVPMEKREVVKGTLPTNPQILLDTITNYGCAKVIWDNERIYFQGIECPPKQAP